MIQSLVGGITNKIVIIILLTILPLNALVIVSMVQSIAVVIEQGRVSLENMANFYIQDLDNQLSGVNYYLYDLSERDAAFIRLIHQGGDDAYTLAKTQMAARLRTNIETIGNADGYFTYGKQSGDFLLVLLQRSTSSGTWHSPSQEYRSAVAGYIKNEGVYLAKRWSLVDINEQKWLIYINEFKGFYYGAVISIDQSVNALKEAAAYNGISVTVSSSPVAAAEKGVIRVTSSSGRIDLSLSIETTEIEIIKTLPLIQWFGIVLAFLYLALIPVLLFVLNRALLRPLNKIHKAILRLKSGDREYRIGSHHKYAKEFIIINRAFNEMVDSIDQLKIENYEKEMAHQKIMLRNLQLQIRPHFLLNMFKLVYGLAQIGETADVQKLALYLSDYFRYIFRNDADLEPLEKEIELIRQYLEISSIRYPCKFKAVLDIEEKTLAYLVPPLLVHNFVENIFEHAMAGKDFININIKTSIFNGKAHIRVQDDGAGMPPETVTQINNGTFDTGEGKSFRIGIYNSYKRIRYFYGGDGKVEAESELRKGSIVSIIIPKKEEDYEPVNS
ncbi:MAG: histidine kinase [Clostridiales bacterium]|jgi:sensor histidine kinase YesM|nr:histidine kinase [Clostridiales bacterium]